MAALSVREDQTTGQFILAPRLLPRLAGTIGNLAWVALFAIFFLVPTFAEGRHIDWVTLLTFSLIFLVSFGATLFGTLTTTTVAFDQQSRMLILAKRWALFRPAPIQVSFNALANIEVQFYRQSSGRYSHNAYRVNAIDKEGRRTVLNWDGKRDEMLALAQKISAVTGAPVLDQTEKPASTLDQVIEMVRNLGLPLPREDTPSPQETREQLQTPAADTLLTETMTKDENLALPPTAREVETQTQELTSIEESSGESFTQGVETIPQEKKRIDWRNLSGLSIDALEQRVASDPRDSDARYALARRYYARGQLDRAIESYQEALRLDTSNAEAQNDLGVALQRRGNRADAEAAYRRAIALDPFSFNAHLNLGLLLARMNRAAEASQEFFQARQSAQGDEETRAAEAASSGARMESRLSE